MEIPNPIAAGFLEINHQRVERLGTKYQNSTLAGILTDETDGEVVYTEEMVIGIRQYNAYARRKMVISQENLNDLMASDPEGGGLQPA